MSLKPPSPEQGDAGLVVFKKAAKLFESSLSNRFSREMYRKDLARWQKLYTTLAAKRIRGSHAAKHFAKLAKLCGELLSEYGPEAPPKRRPKPSYTPAPLAYPDFPDAATLRVHFLESDSLRIRRALELAAFAPAVSRQLSGTGRALVSVGGYATDIRLFARIADTLGASIVRDLTQVGFDLGYGGRPTDLQPGESWFPKPLDPKQPLARIWSDNRAARAYVRPARRPMLGVLVPDVDSEEIDLPSDITVWDPDPRFRRLLELTGAGKLHDAAGVLDSLPGHEREILFDEVIYLRFLTGGEVRANDIRLLAKKHATTSLIAGRLLDELEVFLGHLDYALQHNRPNLEEISVLSPDFGSYAVPPAPPASNWPAYREYCVHSGSPGRIFSVCPESFLGDYVRVFERHMLDAENAFRRERDIPEIGRGWASEVALYDLIRSIWPSAIHQWRSGFLGMQSIDVYVQELRLAIEYQGQQHYEPIALFGGEEGFRRTKARDERKHALLSANGVQLLRWRYDVPITRESLVASLKEIGLKLPGAP